MACGVLEGDTGIVGAGFKPALLGANIIRPFVVAGFNKYICPIKKKPEIICIYNGRKPALSNAE
ncbi:hypothetical protein AGMMS49938_00410 [Fibrobacterales bacterium]|nr:hypothetical protein AGMMS49938_00410 [Fibrobacterales bacterium]